MKIPATFKLAGLHWRVEQTNDISELGHCDSDAAVIRLRKNLPPQIKAATFCHELIHALKYATGEQTHDEK